MVAASQEKLKRSSMSTAPFTVLDDPAGGDRALSDRSQALAT